MNPFSEWGLNVVRENVMFPWCNLNSQSIKSTKSQNIQKTRRLCLPCGIGEERKSSGVRSQEHCRAEGLTGNDSLRKWAARVCSVCDSVFKRLSFQHSLINTHTHHKTKPCTLECTCQAKGNGRVKEMNKRECWWNTRFARVNCIHTVQCLLSTHPV